MKTDVYVGSDFPPSYTRYCTLFIGSRLLTLRSHLQGSSSNSILTGLPSKVGPIGCPDILVNTIQHCAMSQKREDLKTDIIACHSALKLVGHEPEPSQATDVALACCFLGNVLRVGCHYFPPPLEVPTFATRYLHGCTTREILVAKGGTMGENTVL